METEALEYIEYTKTGKIPIKFLQICPYSSNAIQNQICKKEKKVTVVSFFDQNDNFTKLIKEDINKQINELELCFIPTIKLHCTFLGLDPKKELHSYNSNNDFKSIKQKVRDFFSEKRTEDIIQILN